MDYPRYDFSVTDPRKRDEMGMECQIHFMEMEAYSSVLRAFIAQSDLLSWVKEALITDLRRELNVTDTEHGELLAKINSDKTIKMIREWRKGTPCAQESLSAKVNTPGFPSYSVGNAPQKKVKTSHASVSKSQKHVSHDQPSSATFPPPVPVIFRGDQCVGELAMLSRSSGQSMRIVGNSHPPSKGKVRGLSKSQLKTDFQAPDSWNTKKISDYITIRETGKLIHEVKTVVYGRKIPDHVEVEKAKLVLRDHERSLLEALDELADVSDDDDSPNQMQHHYSQEELPGNGQGMVVHSELHGRAGRLHGFPSQSFRQTQSIRLRVPRSIK